jgi:hypothetical protein
MLWGGGGGSEMRGVTKHGGNMVGGPGTSHVNYNQG